MKEHCSSNYRAVNKDRLDFPNNVGLNYLTLSRMAEPLSGG